MFSWLDATLYDALPYCIVTLSMVVTFKYLRFPDVTVSASFVLGAAVSAVTVVQWHVAPFVALILAILSGACAGAVTAAIHVLLEIEPIVASIISAFGVYAINQTLLRPTIPYGTESTFLTWAEGIDRGLLFMRVPWHPVAILLFAVLVLVLKVGLDWLLASEAGLALRALEDSQAGEGVLARLGVRPGAIKVLGLSIGNGLVGLSGALISMKEGAANLHRGLDILITGLIAYLIGQAVLHRRIARHRVRPTTAAIAGALIYFGVVGLSYRVGVPTELTRLILAALVAITIGRVRWRKRESKFAAEAAALRSESGSGQNGVLNVSYAYPSSDLPVLDGVTAEFPSGAITQLKGGNAAGKTTLLRLVAGYLEPVLSGRIVLGGQDVTLFSERRLRAVRYVDQNPVRSVVRTTDVLDFLSLCMLDGRPSPFRKAVTPKRLAIIRSRLEEHGFPADLLLKHGSTLSGGEIQLVNLLGFLVESTSPILVLLDEPLNGLDRGNRERVKELLKLLRGTGAAIVVVNHASDDLGADRVIDLDTVRHSGQLQSG